VGDVIIISYKFFARQEADMFFIHIFNMLWRNNPSDWTDYFISEEVSPTPCRPQ